MLPNPGDLVHPSLFLPAAICPWGERWEVTRERTLSWGESYAVTLLVRVRFGAVEFLGFGFTGGGNVEGRLPR